MNLYPQKGTIHQFLLVNRRLIYPILVESSARRKFRYSFLPAAFEFAAIVNGCLRIQDQLEKPFQAGLTIPFYSAPTNAGQRFGSPKAEDSFSSIVIVAIRMNCPFYLLPASLDTICLGYLHVQQQLFRAEFSRLNRSNEFKWDWG